MKIDICLLSCNDNIKYYSFFPYVKQYWEKILGTKCILIFIGHEIPELLKPYLSDIILYEPHDNIHSAFIAQNIRILYPALLNCDNGVIIADIDIIPLSNKYFSKQIENISDDKFVNYTYENKCDSIKEYYMCYNIGLPKTWSNIFKINSINDVKNTLTNWYNKIIYIYDDRYRSKCIGFHNDQLMLYKYINDYENKQDIILLPRVISRLNIHNNNYNIDEIVNQIKNDIWYDFHIPKNINKNIIKNIFNKL
jgi:hypothetical protein